MQFLEQLSHPVVRDLAWAVFSEDLILAASIGSASNALQSCALCVLTPARESWLLALDGAPQALLDHLGASREGRLGLYFESLWHFFLKSDPAAELLAHNLPVRDAGQTLGEFDCLYRCRDSDEIVHLELAVKFYLHTGNRRTGDSRAEWLGPGRHDRLDSKLDHLAAHQTRLAAQPAAQRLLAADNLIPQRREVAIKGRLFRRLGQECLPPRGFNPAMPLFDWGPISALNTLGADRYAHYQTILSRPHWLSPLAPALGVAKKAHVQVQLLPIAAPEMPVELQRRFAKHFHPLLVASLDANCRELQRFFVCPPLWPIEETA